MNTKYIVGVDAGTMGARTVVFDLKGTEMGSAYYETPTRYPKPGWVEHDPEEIWRSTLETCRLALSKTGLSGSDIAAIGITNQRETTILWDRATGEPVYRAIVWQDRRT